MAALGEQYEVEWLTPRPRVEHSELLSTALRFPAHGGAPAVFWGEL